MQMQEATSYVSKCFNGEPASCSFACPFRLDVRSFMDKAQRGRWLPAYKTLRNATVFPAIVSTLCPQPCRNHCQRTTVGDEALAIRDLEAAAVRLTKNRKPDSFVIPPKAEKVAVIGAGAAGLSCALSLAQKRYQVTVFEKDTGWGGALRSHPDFEKFDEDIALQFSVVEADFRFNTDVTSLDMLDDYNVIYIATGENGSDFGLKDSWEPELQTTANPRVFMGGGVVGSPLMEAIAQGPEVSKAIEHFLATGKAAKTNDDFDRTKCNRYLRHDGATSMPLVTAASPEGYTDEEARAEAARCFKCDCDYCERSCEMLEWFRKKPHRIAVEVFTDSQGSTLSSRTLTREAYSCNICGKCKSVCPEAVDIGALLQFSREDRMKTGIHIPAFHDYWLREQDFYATEGFFAAPPKGRDTCAYAFFPGCKLGAGEPAHVLKSYDYLSEKLDAGIILGCCGAPAYWAGDRQRLETNISLLRTHWEKLGKPTLVFACASCENLFSLFMPEIPRVSLYEILGKDDAVKPAALFENAAIFDPCAAREDDAMQQGVRHLAGRAGVKLEELKDPNRCCGYGGHISQANPALYDQITTNRAQASDKPYIVYCANCRDVFEQKDKECAHILDLVFDLPRREKQDLQTKRVNSLEVKKQMVQKLTGETFTPESHPWNGVNLNIPDDLRDDLDRRLIVEDDLKEAIWLAETSGEKFVDEAEGLFQCSMVKPALTYWVQYKPAGENTFEVTSAYSHRMHFDREA
jgi:Fe-S oxidoreductase